MKTNLLTLFLLSILLSVSSCKKFLEEQSQTDMIPRTAASLNELLIGAAYGNNGIKAYDISLRMVDDDVMENGFDFGGTITDDLFSAHTWQPENPALPELATATAGWQMYYPSIMGCNSILNYASKVTGSITEIENVEGQAYLLRAYCYFMLVNLYAKPYTDRLSNPAQDPGVPLMLDAGLSLEGKPRNTVAEVYNQILSDLDKGIALMERSGKNNNAYRMSHVAGYLLASRVHLYMGNWQKAVDAATNVLIRKSDLMDLNAWGTVNQNTKPIVDRLNAEAIWVFGSNGVFAFSYFTDAGNFRLSDELLSLFEPGDFRSSIYIRNKKPIKRPTASTIIYGQSFRVSEALLNRAEAYAQLNKMGQLVNGQLALNDLNTLRKKRINTANYQDLSSTGADDLLRKCALEKRREFFDEECHRWFDLRRSGMPSIQHVLHPSSTQNLIYSLQDHDPAYVFQIPKAARDNNPKLIPNPEPAIRGGL